MVRVRREEAARMRYEAKTLSSVAAAGFDLVHPISDFACIASHATGLPANCRVPPVLARIDRFLASAIV